MRNSLWQAQQKVVCVCVCVFKGNSCILERLDSDAHLHFTQQKKKKKRRRGRFSCTILSGGAAPRWAPGGYLFTLSLMLWRLKLPLGCMKRPGWGAAGTPVNGAALMIPLEQTLPNEV